MMKLSEIIAAIAYSQFGTEYDELLYLRNQTSLLETYGKLRSENCHSSFLKWLFEDDSLNASLAHGAVYRLVLLIQKWATIQGTDRFATVNKKDFSKVLIDHLSVNEVKREFNVQVPNYGLGRIDILIKCTINCGQKKDYKLNIIIENKVDAKETTKKKGKLYQTDAYVDYFDNNHKNDLNLFVFLTPAKTRDLYNVEMYPDGSHSKRYVHLNYQELYDNVIFPISVLPTVSPENKFRLEDYIKAISKPSVNNVQNKSALVMNYKNRELLLNYFERNKDLILEAILAKYETTKEPSFYDAYETLGGSSTSKYRVNGYVGIMWEVIAEFAKTRLNAGKTPTEIEDEIRTLVGTPNTKVKYFADEDTNFNKYSNGNPRCKSFNHNGKDYYVSDQWSGDGNFANFVKNVNNSPDYKFEVKNA